MQVFRKSVKKKNKLIEPTNKSNGDANQNKANKQIETLKINKMLKISIEKIKKRTESMISTSR